MVLVTVTIITIIILFWGGRGGEEGNFDTPHFSEPHP